MDVYNYTGNYNQITVEGEIGEAGILEGAYGNLKFRRCQDGISIYESSFAGSGFVCGPTSANIGLPGTINGIPVTETHQSISIERPGPIAVEVPNLKRAYFKFSKKEVDLKSKETDDAFSNMIIKLMCAQDNIDQKDKALDISVDFYKSEQSVEYCEIECDQKCILHKISAKHLFVKAPIVVLEGSAYSELEQAVFVGKVYPYVYSDWDVYTNINYFSGVRSLKMVEGSLGGEDGWCFSDCVSLEKVHLANGINKIPSYAFKNCSLINDLFIPDTVLEIGEYAFSDCTNLKTIHLPNGIKKITKGMFKDCRSLTKCFLSDDIEVIESEAFAGCISMKKPWIPKNIKSISETAFDNPEWGCL